MDEENGSVVTSDAGTDTSVSDSTTEETTSSTADDQVDTSQQETDGDSQEEVLDDSLDTDETETERPKRGAEARKEQLNTEIRDLVATRNAIRSEVEAYNAQVYRPATVEELLEQQNPETGDYYSRLEAQLEAMQQERAIEKYNNQVTESRMTLHSDAHRAIQDFPIFDSNNPEYNPQIAAEVDQILAQSIIVDPRTNQVIGSRIPVYQLYKSHAVAAKANERRAEMTAQRNAEKQITNTDLTPGAQGKQTAFNKLSVSEMEARPRKQGHDV